MSQISLLHSISTSRNTLPIACAVTFVLWLSVKPDGYSWTNLLLPLTAAFLSIYLIAELNNRFSLLRIGSRMIACTLALLLAMTTQIHASMTAPLLTVLTLFGFHSMMSCYQAERPGLVFQSMLLLSISTFIQPSYWFMVPAYLVCLNILRALTPRCFMAALFGLLVPYWLSGGTILINGDFNDVFLYFRDALPPLVLPDYTAVPIQHWAQFVVATILFIAGTIDLYQKSYLDKTQTRICYIAVLIHGIAAIVLILLQMHYFNELFPLLLIDAAIIGGHYLALTHNRPTFVFALSFLTLWAAVTTMQLWII